VSSLRQHNSMVRTRMCAWHHVANGTCFCNYMHVNRALTLMSTVQNGAEEFVERGGAQVRARAQAIRGCSWCMLLCHSNDMW
jgi:hypothetical protein